MSNYPLFIEKYTVDEVESLGFSELFLAFENGFREYLDLKIQKWPALSETLKRKIDEEILKEVSEKEIQYDLEKAISYNLLVRALVNRYKEFEDIKKYLDKIGTKFFTVHDAYAIFCMLYPEFIRTANVSMSVDDVGSVNAKNGGKHEFVLGFDYEKFEEFLYDGLEIKQRKK